MKTLLLLVLTVAICGPLLAQGVPSLTRTSPISIYQAPLAPGAGPTDRDADHATVAMNSERDIVVAFQTSRPDITGFGNMKQVEFAYYEWQSGDTWDFVKTEVVGSTGHNPIGLNQSVVRCERPDIIAVDDKFFIVWTRRYQASGDPNEPAVLECAWIDKVAPGNVQVLNNGLASGQGVILDMHVPAIGSRKFWVKDCAGVPGDIVKCCVSELQLMQRSS